MRWRWNQLLFSASFRKAEPKRWGRFISFAKAHGVLLGPLRVFLLNLLPVHRPLGSLWMDTRHLRNTLLEGFHAEVGSDSG